MGTNRIGKTVTTELEKLEQEYRSYWESERGQERTSYGHAASVLALLQAKGAGRG